MFQLVLRQVDSTSSCCPLLVFCVVLCPNGSTVPVVYPPTDDIRSSFSETELRLSYRGLMAAYSQSSIYFAQRTIALGLNVDQSDFSSFCFSNHSTDISMSFHWTSPNSAFFNCMYWPASNVFAVSTSTIYISRRNEAKISSHVDTFRPLVPTDDHQISSLLFRFFSIIVKHI